MAMEIVVSLTMLGKQSLWWMDLEICDFSTEATISRTIEVQMFNPNAIVNDVNHHLLIFDEWNFVYIIDCEGNLIGYIECPCTEGVSVNTDKHLVVGELTT